MSIKEGTEIENKNYGPVDTIPWNPAEQIHQPRFLAKGELFRTPIWYQQFYFGLSSGIYGLTDKEWQQTNVPVALSAGYEFNRYSGFRLTGTYVQIPRKHTRHDLQSIGADLDYVFNVTNYMYGYNPKRIVNFGIVPGIGLIYARRHEEHSLTVKAQLGMHFGLNLGQKTEVYAEPWFGLTDDKVNLSRNNPAAYDVLYGVRLGAIVRLRPYSSDVIPDSTNHRPFLEYAQGLTAPIDRDFNGLHTLGASYQLSFGEWISPAFGLRVGFNASQYYWDVVPTARTVVEGIQVHPHYDTWYAGANISGRLEVLLNPFNFGKHKEGMRKVDMNIGLGAEVGWLMKNGVPGTLYGIRKFYYGLTAAPQVLYQFDKRNYFFIEPRVTMLNYSVPYSNSDGSKAYSDHIASLHAGIRIQPHAKWERPLSPTGFEQQLWFSASVGAARQMQTNKILGEGHFNINAQVGAAYEFAPITAFRVRAEYWRMGFNEKLDYQTMDFGEPIRYTALWNKTYNILQFKLGYLLNLNSLLQGYQPNRKLNTYVEFGPLFSMNQLRQYTMSEGELAGGSDLRIIDNTTGIKTSYGAFGGMLADFRVHHRWSIQVQTDMSLYAREGFLQHYFNGDWKDCAIQFNIGAAYHLNP